MWGLGEAGQLGIPYRLLRLLSTSRDGEVGQHSTVNAELDSNIDYEFSGIVSFPHRLRVFCVPLILDDSIPNAVSTSLLSAQELHTPMSRGISRDIVRSTLRRFFSQLGLSASPEVLGCITCRLHENKGQLIVTLTDSVLLENSSLELSHFFTRSVCHPSEVKFTAVACGEGHTIALGYTLGNPSDLGDTLDFGNASDLGHTSPNSKHHHSSSRSRSPPKIKNQVLLSWGQYSYSQLGINVSSQQQLNLSAIILGTTHGNSPRKSKRSAIPCSDEYEKTSRNTPCLISMTVHLTFSERHTPKSSPGHSPRKRVRNMSEVRNKSMAESVRCDNSNQPIITGLRSGGCSNLAFVSDGNILVWGGNDFGMLGVSEKE